MSSAISDWQKFCYAASFMMAVGTTIDQNYNNILKCYYIKYRGLNYYDLYNVIIKVGLDKLCFFAPIILLSYAESLLF